MYKKIIFSLILLFIIPFSTKAEVLMGFMDGTLYDQSGLTSGIPKYICFMNGECIDKDNNVTTRSKLGLVPLTTPIIIPIIKTESVQNPSQSTNIISTPEPQTASIPTFEIINKFYMTNIFEGSPYLLGTFDNYNSDRTINNKYLVIGINLSREEKSTQDIYGLYCTNLATNQTSKVDTTSTGSTNEKVDYKKRVGSIVNPGNYSCYFKFSLPEGEFTSEVIEVSLE